MWLLDANMDVHLVTLLNLEGACNGALVTEAVNAGFNCLLTRNGKDPDTHCLKSMFSSSVEHLPHGRASARSRAPCWIEAALLRDDFMGD